MATNAGPRPANSSSAASSADADSAERGGHSSKETKPPAPIRSETVATRAAYLPMQRDGPGGDVASPDWAVQSAGYAATRRPECARWSSGGEPNGQGVELARLVERRPTVGARQVAVLSFRFATAVLGLATPYRACARVGHQPVDLQLNAPFGGSGCESVSAACRWSSPGGPDDRRSGGRRDHTSSTR